MKLLFWIVGLPLLLVAGFFAIANRGPATINLWPFADPFEAPLFIAIIVPLYVGVLVGAIIAWGSGRRTRSRARTEAKRATALQRENEALKARLDTLEAARAASLRTPSEAATTAAPPVPYLQ